MSKEKPQKPKLSERNQIMWVERNFKFIREHSTAYPEPMWHITNTKHLIIGVVVLFTVLLVFILFDYVRISIACVWVTWTIFLLVEAYKAEKRTDVFYKSFLSREGEIINPINSKMVNKNTTVILIVGVLMLLIIGIYIGTVIYFELIGRELPTYFYNLFYYPFIYHVLFSNSTAISTPFPCIFMDIDEGMLFGGALFSYDILSGIRPTGNGNGFDLYYEGKRVASGKMLPDDMRYLQEMLEIRKKYSDYLS